MPPIFWTGKLSKTTALLVNLSNFAAWINGNVRDTKAMKQRLEQGYNGAFSSHVSKYDELGWKFQSRAASLQLAEIDLKGKEVLDVGCGTGALAFLALECGATKVTCGDISQNMLDQSRGKAKTMGFNGDQIAFRRLDAETLPFEDESFDVVMTGMTLGLLPNQQKAISEMARVARPGGLVAVGAHGPEHYWEAIDACFRAVTKRYVFGYRLEFWPRRDVEVEYMMKQASLKDVRTIRTVWHNEFPTGGEVYDFFAAVTSAWWYANFPSEKIPLDLAKTRKYFDKKGIRRITDDLVFAYGIKHRD
jgi:ubiquinone/menaquinone biosynthesis C-methylase UbiE